jgi:hypothetical protein
MKVVDNNVGERAYTASQENTPTVIVGVDEEDTRMIKEIMRSRQAIKTQEKYVKTLVESLKSKHAKQNVNIILKTSRRVLAWFAWTKQSAKYVEEQVIPAGWKLGVPSHSRFYPRDPSGKVSNKQIDKAIAEIENAIESN